MAERSDTAKTYWFIFAYTSYPMKNTTKLKQILQLFTVTLDMDDSGNFVLTAINKRTRASRAIVNKQYTVAVSKVFSLLLQELKARDSKLNQP